MEHISLLQHSLKQYFTLTKYKLECLSQFILALIIINDVNLNKVARCLLGNAQHTSKYKRLKRFIKDLKIDHLSLWKLIDSLFCLPNQFYVAMDRTNWKFGKININILTIVIVYKGVGIPVIWSLLSKRGNSNAFERIELLKRLIQIVPKSRIIGLLLDREFDGTVWITWLMDQNLPFVIRAKESITATNTKNQATPLKQLFQNLSAGEVEVLKGKRTFEKVRLYLVATRLSTGELLILVTPSNPELALTRYRKRWEIEVLFSCLKKRGFNFENTHLIDIDRIGNLMFVLTLTFIWAYLQGEIIVKEKVVKLKKHGYPEKSIFRIGLEFIASAIFQVSLSSKRIKESILTIFKPRKAYLANVNYKLVSGVP